MTLSLGKIEGRKRRWWCRMRWLDGITDSREMNLGKLQKMVRDREGWSAAVHEDWKSQIWFRCWTTTRRRKRRRSVERVHLWSAHRQQWLNVNVRGTKTKRSSQTPKSLPYTRKEMEACHWRNLMIGITDINNSHSKKKTQIDFIHCKYVNPTLISERKSMLISRCRYYLHQNLVLHKMFSIELK